MTYGGRDFFLSLPPLALVALVYDVGESLTTDTIFCVFSWFFAESANREESLRCGIQVEVIGHYWKAKRN